MLQVLSKTNLDLTMFIGNDESHHKIVGLNLGLFQKGYHCEGTGAIATTFMTDLSGKSIEGLRTRFTKTDSSNSYNSSSRYYNNSSRGRYSASRSHFNRKITNENTISEMRISRGIRSNRTEIDMKILPSSGDRKMLFDCDIVSRYSRHIKTTEEMTILPCIQSKLELNNENFSPKLGEEEEAKLHMDSVVVKVREFEENFKCLYPFLVLRNFTGISNTAAQEISLAEFGKFARQIDIIQEVSIPSKCAKKKFIEICEIFRDNKVLTKLKANNFEFRKLNNRLSVEFFGIQMINDDNFKPFRFFDHPGINFCADYLDKSRTFDSIEAKISKEIITRI